MPPTRHPQARLTAVAVRSKRAGRHADGNGLYLLVKPSGARSWVLRVMVAGRRQDFGLGSVRLVSLADARAEATRLRRVARGGADVRAALRQARVVVPTFAAAAIAVHEAHASTFRNAKHRAQWLRSVATYAYPTLEHRPIDQITSGDVLAVLSPIWTTKRETARRVRQRLRAIFEWAAAAGHRTGENPVIGVARALPATRAAATHFAALPYADVRAFVTELREATAAPLVRWAFEFLILTAARTSEVLRARWDEFDFAADGATTWTIPAERMKTGRAHRVPLAPEATAILREAIALAGDSPYVFPGRRYGRPWSQMVFLMVLRRLKRPITVHGFRSAFRDWAAERTNFAREICEAALAHVVADQVEAAYLRTDLFEKRRALMATWATFVTPQAGSNVVTIRRA